MSIYAGPVENICVTHLHGYVLSSFPLVVKKLTTIPEYPSSVRSPHAMALKQLINEEVCIKRSTVGTLGSVDCLLKHTFIKHNKYVVDQTLEYFDVSSSFPLVVKKLTTIPEYPSSVRSPHAMALKQLTSILLK
jgi:hypothetical protein